jgi:teichuronic acid exporter
MSQPTPEDGESASGSAPEQKALADRAVHGIAWVAIEKWAGRLVSLLVFMILGRLLSPSDFGLMALSFTIATILSVFVENGFAQALVQRKSIDQLTTSTAFWSSLVVATGLYAVLAVATPFLAALYDQPQLNYLIPVSGLVLFTSAFSSVPQALLERDLQFKILTIRQLSGILVGAVVAVALAFGGAGVWALVVQPVVTGFVGAIVLWVQSSWRPRLEFSVTTLKAIWGFSAQVVGVEFFNSMQSNIDKFILGSFFSADVLGYYFIAQRVLMILMEVVAAVLGRVSLSTLSRLQDEPARFIKFFNSLTFGSAALAFPLYATLIAYPSQITRVLFGPGWDESVPMLVLMAPAIMLASVSYFDRSVLLSRRHGGVAFGLAIGQFVFGTVALLVAVPFGILAVCAARTIRQFLYWPVRIWALHKYGDVPVRSYLVQFVGPTLAAIALVAVGWLLGATAWGDVTPVLLFVVPAACVTLGVYSAVLYVVARRRTTEIARVGKRAMQRRGSRSAVGASA